MRPCGALRRGPILAVAGRPVAAPSRLPLRRSPALLSRSCPSSPPTNQAKSCFEFEVGDHLAVWGGRCVGRGGGGSGSPRAMTQCEAHSV